MGELGDMGRLWAEHDARLSSLERAQGILDKRELGCRDQIAVIRERVEALEKVGFMVSSDLSTADVVGQFNRRLLRLEFALRDCGAAMDVPSDARDPLVPIGPQLVSHYPEVCELVRAAHRAAQVAGTNAGPFEVASAELSALCAALEPFGGVS